MLTALAVPEPCWSCGSPNSSISDMHDGDGSAPKAGDISICFYCGAPGVISESLSVREPTKDEMDMLLIDEDVLKHIELVTLARQMKTVRDRQQ